MNSRFVARRSAEDFAQGVDALLEDPTSVTEHRDAELLALVGSMRAATAPVARTEFVHDLRAQLMAEAQTVLTPQHANLVLPVRTKGARERRLVAAASVAVLLGGSATMAAASQNALPGEALYPIKRGLEQARSSLAFTEDSKGSTLLGSASGRLAEVARLAEGGGIGSQEQIARTLADFEAQTREGVALLFDAYATTGDPADVAAVRAFARDALAQLESLAGTLPESLTASLAQLAQLLRGVDSEAVRLCSECAADDVVEIPELLLTHAEALTALDNARSSTRELSNNHPVTIDEALRLPLIPQLPARPQQQKPSASPTSPSTSPTPAQAAPSQSSEGLLPAIVDLLRQGQTSTSGGSGTSKPAPSPSAPPSPGLVGGLVDELGKVVGTILPNPDEKLLP